MTDRPSWAALIPPDRMRPPTPASGLEDAANLLEKEGHPLPVDFHELLKKCDGGLPDPSWLIDSQGRELHVQEIFGVGGPATPDGSNVLWLLTGVPPRVCPFAGDNFGGVWAIDLRGGGNRGPIVYLDPDEMPEDIPDDLPLPYVAADLAEFTGLLQDLDIPDPAPPTPKRGLRRLFGG